VRVAWLNDLPLEGYGSGAELSSKLIIKEGIRRGHDIDVVLPHTFTTKGYDLFIIKNVVSFSKALLGELLKENYVNYPSDYAWCKWRLWYAMLPKCKKCKGIEFWKDFYDLSKLNIFLSPLHKRAYEYVLGKLKGICIPSPIDTSLFYDMKLPREKNSVICINPFSFKGVDNLVTFAEEHKQYKYYWAGNSDVEGKLINFKKLGYIPYQELNRILNRCEYWIEQPSTPQPCFPGFAKVLTEDGWRSIRSIKVGTKVVTHLGRLKKVTATHRRVAKEMTFIQLKIRTTWPFRAFRVTPKHPLLTSEGWTEANKIKGELLGLGKPCLGCGKPIFTFLRVCSRTCQQKTRTFKVKKPALHNLSVPSSKLGYIAGMLDGEGNITSRFDYRYRKAYHPYLKITNTNLDSLKFIQSSTGMGNIRRKKDKKRKRPIYEWFVEKKDDIYTLLTYLSPCLIVKKALAQKVLETFRKLKNSPPKKLWNVSTDFMLAKVPVRYVTTYKLKKGIDVYNLDVEEEHSYIAEGVVAHNCERQSLEAKLAGCNIITNDMVGATSYSWFKDLSRLRKEVSEAPKRFWNEVEKRL